MTHSSTSGRSDPSGRPDAGALRASDTERERVADALRRHHLDGRLDTDELQERLGRCYAARTTAALEPLLADLPADGPARPRGPRGAWPPWLGVPAQALLVSALVLLTVAAVAHGHPGPLPFLAVLLLVRFAARGPRRPWGPSARRA